MISSIRAITRDPLESFLKVLTLATGSGAATIHILLMVSGEKIIWGHLIIAIIIILYSGLLFELAFRRSQRSNEFQLRILLGEKDPKLRTRKLIEVLLFILLGVSVGIASTDYMAHNYLHLERLFLESPYYVSIMFLLGAFQVLFFGFISYLGFYSIPLTERRNKNIYSKVLAGSIVILTTVIATFYFALDGSSIYGLQITIFDPVVFIYLGFVSWNILGNLTLQNKRADLAQINPEKSTSHILYYWLKEIGPVALFTIILTVLMGSLYLGLAVLGIKFLPFLSISWFLFSASLIFLGVLQSIIRAFLYNSEKYHKEES